VLTSLNFKIEMILNLDAGGNKISSSFSIADIDFMDLPEKQPSTENIVNGLSWGMNDCMALKVVVVDVKVNHVISFPTLYFSGNSKTKFLDTPR